MKQKITYQRLAVILGNCLFPNHELLSPDEGTLFFMAEDHGLCTHFKYHKHKLVFFLSAMRSHATTIANNHDISYLKLHEGNKQQTYEAKLSEVLDENPSIREIVTYDIEDHFFEERLKEFSTARGITLIQVDSPGFLTDKASFRQYLDGVKKPFMHTFYQKQRKRFNLLMSDGKPVGGKWSFDEENRKKLPKGMFVPNLRRTTPTDETTSVIELVDALFPSHPGSTDNYRWITTREEALAELEHFLQERFQHFGPYEDAIDPVHTFLFHSTLSPYLNVGLITSKEVINRTMEFAAENQVHLPSVEGFVRQIIGWREFMRGIYHNYEAELDRNFFGHSRKMKACWYDGTTSIPPLDDAIKKATQHAYTHHIERLMVLGSIMLLCELDPKEVYKWFMELYVDSSDWVMAPNVYGMSQFADGGIFATKPYIGGSNYILKMSSYSKKGEWSEIVNGLYWRFISVNRSVFEQNPRMGMIVRTLDKMGGEKKSNLFRKAEAFIARVSEA